MVLPAPVTYLSIGEGERGEAGVEDEVIEVAELLDGDSELDDGLQVGAGEQYKAWGEWQVMD